MARPKKKDKDCITKADLKKAIKEVKDEAKAKRNKCIGAFFQGMFGIIFLLMTVALLLTGLFDFSIFVKGEGIRYFIGCVGYWVTLVGLCAVSATLLSDEGEEGKKKPYGGSM